ncbi:phosphatase PAP2 family protein [Parasalinivibrio latis]|uniref:phosphatase PAP2 family protein n=1 Tax=Parasalinivibrio latis TaxID=2952610 RepID=UPI0030DFE0F4
MKPVPLWRSKAWIMVQAAGVVALLKLDQPLFLAINAGASVLPDTFWSMVTLMGDGMIMFAIFPFVFFRHHRLMVVALCLTVMALLVIHGIKGVTDWARPPAVLPPDAFNLIGKPYTGNSFPSGHAATAMATAMLWRSVLPEKFGNWLLGAAGLVAVSRIAVGIHWPTDVLVGLAIGLVLAWGAGTLMRNVTWSDRLWVKAVLLLMLAGNALSLFTYRHGYKQVEVLVYLLAIGSLAACIVQGFRLYFDWRDERKKARSAVKTIP